MEIKHFPNKLKMFRRSNGYSQKKVARILGLLDTSMLSRWERGIALPNTIQALCLARIYDTEPHHLFDELWNQLESKSSLLAQNDEPFNSNQSCYI